MGLSQCFSKIKEVRPTNIEEETLHNILYRLMLAAGFIEVPK